MRLSDLKKATEDLQTKMATGEIGSKTGGGKEDDRFWYPKLEKKIGSGKIRFLPASEAMHNRAGAGVIVLPWAKLFIHKFKSANGSWFWENCPTSIGLPCPVCESNKELWETGIKANQEIVRGRSRKVTFHYNALILSDPANPENVGKVKIFKSGQKIFDMLMEAEKPKFADQTPVHVFDLWKGSDFSLRIKDVEGNVNYDSSSFDQVGRPLAQTDEAIEEIWKLCHDLSEFVDPKIFKSEEELKVRFEKAIGKKPTQVVVPSAPVPSAPSETPKETVASIQAKVDSAAVPSAPSAKPQNSDIDYFKSLVEEDL
jgi:hypothetical protein